MSAPGADSRTKVFTNQFDVDLNAHIIKVSSITMRFPKMDCTDSADSKYKTFAPGNPVYGNITFEGNIHSDTFGDIRSWVKDCYDGNDIRKNITINIRTQQSEDAARTFNLLDTFPVHFDWIDVSAGGGAVAKWSLEVRVNRVEMA